MINTDLRILANNKSVNLNAVFLPYIYINLLYLTV